MGVVGRDDGARRRSAWTLIAVDRLRVPACEVAATADQLASDQLGHASRSKRNAASMIAIDTSAGRLSATATAIAALQFERAGVRLAAVLETALVAGRSPRAGSLAASPRPNVLRFRS